jgi:D-beta-D-heptose 7-phosphate kinase/D-beta-D-heptose 1-phosphate adenosyltransferase
MSMIMPAPTSPNGPPRILILGDMMLDRYLDGTVDRISPEAPVPVLHVKRSSQSPGGAANVAINVAGMEGCAMLVGVIGTDDAGHQLRSLLENGAVSCGMLVVSALTPTTIKTRLLAGHNQIARFDEEQILDDDEARAEVVARVTSAAATADLMLISDYTKGVCNKMVVRAAIEAATTHGIPVVVDSKSVDYDMFRGATVITPNRHEAGVAAGFAIRSPSDGLRAAGIIRERYGIDAVVVTLGEQGMAFVTQGDADVIPTRARQVYDVTGAGDSVVAALSIALGRGISMRRACLLANAAAGLQVARVGTSRVTWSEVMDSLDLHAPIARSKIVNRTELQAAVKQARAEGKRVGFTNGCFDILHHGHVELLEAAAHECDLLVVGVNSDASVKRLKGEARPFVASRERQAVLAALSSVGLVCEFEEDTPLELIRVVEPDVLVKGGDYAIPDVIGSDVVNARGGKVITPVFVTDVSTTRIVARIRNSHG